MATVGPSDYPVVTEGSDDSVVTEEDPAVAAVDTVWTQLLPVVEEVVHVLVPLDSVVTEGDPAVSNENFVATRGGYSVNSITYASEESVRKNSPGFELMFKASPPRWADVMPQEPGTQTPRRKKKNAAATRRGRVKRATWREENDDCWNATREAGAIAARLTKHLNLDTSPRGRGAHRETSPRGGGADEDSDNDGASTTISCMPSNASCVPGDRDVGCEDGDQIHIRPDPLATPRGLIRQGLLTGESLLIRGGGGAPDQPKLPPKKGGRKHFRQLGR